VLIRERKSAFGFPRPDQIFLQKSGLFQADRVKGDPFDKQFLDYANRFAFLSESGNEAVKGLSIRNMQAARATWGVGILNRCSRSLGLFVSHSLRWKCKPRALGKRSSCVFGVR
jgi:hypothetical protein